MYDIEIKKGRTFRYDLWYGGEPPPNVIWERNGIVLQGLRVEKLQSLISLVLSIL